RGMSRRFASPGTVPEKTPESGSEDPPSRGAVRVDAALGLKDPLALQGHGVVVCPNWPQATDDERPSDCLPL
ncbi:MAG: hypothetical protein ACUVXD_07050, partial [Thermodesulfobacteriota bacterium]